MYFLSRFSHGVMLRRHVPWLGSGNWQYWIKGQDSLFALKCKINILAPSFFIKEVYTFLKNESLNNFKDLTKNSVCWTPLMKREKKRNRSKCQFALKWCISYKKSHYDLMSESLEGKILYCEGSICVMWCKYLLLLNR